MYRNLIDVLSLLLKRSILNQICYTIRQQLLFCCLNFFASQVTAYQNDVFNLLCVYVIWSFCSWSRFNVVSHLSVQLSHSGDK